MKKLLSLGFDSVALEYTFLDLYKQGTVLPVVVNWWLLKIFWILLSLILPIPNCAFPGRCQAPHHHAPWKLGFRHVAWALPVRLSHVRYGSQWGIPGDPCLGEHGSKGVPYFRIAAGRPSSFQFSIPYCQMVFTGCFNSKQLDTVGELCYWDRPFCRFW